MKHLILILGITGIGYALGTGYPDRAPWDLVWASRDAIASAWTGDPAPEETARFTHALDFTLANEGGYANHPDDPGGPTSRGVTTGTSQTYCNEPDPRRLTDQQVRRIYYQGYWRESGAADLPPPIDLILFDIAVKEGPQVAQNFLATTTSTDPATRAHQIIGRFENHLHDRIRANPRLRTFAPGWTNRIARLRAYVDAGPPTPLTSL